MNLKHDCPWCGHSVATSCVDRETSRGCHEMAAELQKQREMAESTRLTLAERNLRAVIRSSDIPPRDAHDLLVKLKSECSCLYIAGKSVRDLNPS